MVDPETRITDLQAAYPETSFVMWDVCRVDDPSVFSFLIMAERCNGELTVAIESTWTRKDHDAKKTGAPHLGGRTRKHGGP